ncbi:MAG: silent information regulator protein Sir2 [Phycisphaerales bacterium]
MTTTQKMMAISLLVLAQVPDGRGAEKLDRGFIALRAADGSVFLSWRLLKDDPPDIPFRVTRKAPSDTAALILTGNSPYRQTHLVDQKPGTGPCLYELFVDEVPGFGDDKHVAAVRFQMPDGPRPYLSIPLGGEYDFQQVGVGDLDGDGSLEFLVKQPDFNTDPYQKPGYWKPSTTTYKIEAYRLDGTLMWRHDMGWSIEAGIWYSPWVVYDVDGDGRAEVYCKAGEGDPRDEKGLVQTGPEYLVKLDGPTGEVVAKTDWLSRDGFPDYNYYCRNFLTVAYLDGKTPSLIMQRGTYNVIKVQAMDKDFGRIWYWEAKQEKSKYTGQGSHGLIAADVDNDGRDELVLGAAVLDETGRGLWTLEMGHPDICHVGDVDPANPGLEIYYGLESKQKTDGICVVDAATGRKLWTHKEPTFHLHGQGMAADVLADHVGMEVLAGERDFKKRWLYSASGELIEFKEDLPLSPRPLWWDGDPQKEVILGRSIQEWNGPVIQPIEGRVVAVMDCLGDYREEVVTCVQGELRIYSTTIPATDRRPCLLQDHLYRMGVAAQTVGYYYPAQLGLQ